MGQFSLMIPSTEGAPEVADDVRALFDELAHTGRADAYSGECRPALDVLETDAAVEVSLDVPGIEAGALRVLFRAGVLLVVGVKAPNTAKSRPDAGGQTFHLVEREFGRFARAVRVNGAFDVANAEARLAAGELTVVLPKISERRGAAHRIQVTGDPPADR